MKKIVAILFVSVLCFNWLGYRYVFDYLEKKHNQQLEARLDKDNYNENELISIKTAFPIPYFVNSNKFERWNGEIEINGVLYKYVKRRFYNDSIELLCIPNPTATAIKTARHDFFRFANDLQTNNQHNKQESLPIFKNLLSEFCQPVPDWDFSRMETKRQYWNRYLFFIPEVHPESKGQPPEFV
ncbi:MAG: hypothetical protein GC171_15990 [Terrimonas sp.]|nr:hypothetical protein [Terrimonas sp.]